jgi:hypothetical protein
MNRPGDPHNRVKAAPAIAWAPFFLALATPGTTAQDEPRHLARYVGVPANLVPATLIPRISAAGCTLHRHGHQHLFRW